MKNQLVKGVIAKGAGTRGVGAVKANMPGNNVTDYKVTTGTTHKSTFTKGSSGTGAIQPSSTQKVGSKANMPANNDIHSKKVVIGHTKHAPGTVPGYLRGK